MVVNHEYTSETLMFPGYDAASPTRDQVETAWAAHGLVVVAVSENKRTGALKPIVGHKLNRRLHTTSKFTLTGPVAGTTRCQDERRPARSHRSSARSTTAPAASPRGARG